MRHLLFAVLVLASPAVAQHEHHAPPAAAADPHAGHDMSAMEQAPPADTDPHAGHDMSAMDAPAPPPASPPASPPPPGTGQAHAADIFFDPAAMAAARRQLRLEHGGAATRAVLVDRFEARVMDGRDGYLWDAQFRFGADANALVIKTEGEGRFGQSPGGAEAQALWSHAIAPFFDVQAGVRYDVRPDPERAYAVLGIQGILPYWIEMDAALFLSHQGDLTGRIELEHDARITQRLVLQPRIEAEVSAQDVPALGTGAGLTAIAAGLRLRHEMSTGFAPYIGVEYERLTGDTADYARAAGNGIGGWSALIGIRSNF